MAEYEQARTLRAELARIHPTVPERQNDLASTLHNIGLRLHETWKGREAREKLSQARDIRVAECEN